MSKLVHPVVGGYRDENCTFSRVEAQGSRGDILAAKLPHAEETDIRAIVEIIRANVFVTNVIECIVVNGECWAFTLQLENNESTVVASSKEIEIRMRCKNPETVVFTAECLYGGTLGQVPNADRLVFSAGYDELVLGVEQGS